MQEYKKDLDVLSSTVLKAYLDSFMFLKVVPIATDKRKTSNFLFDYSYYAIRERAIISAKSLIEPKGKDKLTLDRIIKDLQRNEEYAQYANQIHSQYEELRNSEGVKRIRAFRDSLCHNIKGYPEAMIYCKDILALINEVMNILDDIYLTVLKMRNENFYKIRDISNMLADDYWSAICMQADKMPNRNNELIELQKLLDC